MSNATENSLRLLEFDTETQFGVSRNGSQRTKHSALLGEYVELIKKWDQVYSLVSKGDLNHLEQRHVTDSLALEPFLRPASDHLDIGSGAGFPGIPLAIYRPDVRVVLNDRSTKKCRFLREVKFRLDLENVEVLEYDIGQRALPDERFNTISIRAVAPPHEAWLIASPLLRHQGLVLLHTQDQFSTDVTLFTGGVVHSCTPSARGWITAVGSSGAA